MAESENLDLTPTDDRKTERPLEPDRFGDYGADAGALEGQPFPGAEVPELEPEVEPLTEAEVREYLESIGQLVSWVAPAPEERPEFWQLDGQELEALTPPLTRVLNKRGAAIRAGLQRIDEVAVAAMLGRYAMTRIRYLRSLEPDEVEPTMEGPEPVGGREPFPTP